MSLREKDLPPNARLHIAQLMDNVNKENLKAKFAKHGTIYELYVNPTKGFGFIQFGSAGDAAAAIAAENMSFFEGKHIGVRLAIKDKYGNTINTDEGGSRGQDQYPDRERDRERDRDRDRERGGDRDAGRFRERDLPPRDLLPRDLLPRDLLPRDLLPRDLPPRDLPPRDLPPRDLPPRDLPPRDLPPRDLLLRGRERSPFRGRSRSPLRDRYDDRFYNKFDRTRDIYERDREDVRRREQFFEDRLPPLRDRLDDRYPPEDDFRREAAFGERERDRERDRDKGGERDRERHVPHDRSRPRDILDRDILDRDSFSRDRDVYERRAPRLPEPALSDPLPPASAPPPPPLPPTDKPIDCEILLMGKHLRDYADLVERRIKGISLNTGLLLISNEGSLTQALEDVTRRKVLYAIILTSQNEVHRSVTLNILHGSPQEHRNMPLEDALTLVDCNFSTYLQDRAVPVKNSSKFAPTAAPPMAPLPGEPPLPRSQPPLPPTPLPPAPQPPAPLSAPAPAPAAPLSVPAIELTIPQLINLLADRKQLTLSEMDRVVSHLQAVRRKMAIEQGLNPDPPTPSGSAPFPAIPKTLHQTAATPVAAPAKPIDPKQAELQAKILSIFNPSGSSTATATANKPMAAATTQQSASKPAMVASFNYIGNASQVAKANPLVRVPTSKATGEINFDSPVVQKVLDKLIQSGPTMLKNLATSANGTASISTFSKTQAGNTKAVTKAKSQSSTASKSVELSRQDSDSQLRAAQQAALKTLALQQQDKATRTMQSNLTQQNNLMQQNNLTQQNQYPPGMVQYPQQAQYQQLQQQQQVAYQQQQQAAYQQPQQQPQQQPPEMVQYQQQYQQPQTTPLLRDPVENKGSGWPRGWNSPAVQSTGSQQTSRQQTGRQSNLQLNPLMSSNPRSSYPSQQQNRAYPTNRSQPKPPGI